MAPALDAAGVTKRFGEVAALDGVDLVVEAGEVHGLLGPNGAGKSTLLRVVFGLVAPDRGQVRIFGALHSPDDPTALLPVGGFVDRPHFWPYLTARRTLDLLATIDGRTDSPSADEVLDTVGLAGVADRRVRGWSTGMLQRLGIAAALLRRPRLLIVDEPTEGLDPVAARQVVELLARLGSTGIAVLVSSHDMAEVDVVCDRATILAGGRVVRSATLAELRAAVPPRRHRLRTSDDAATVALACAHPVTLQPGAQGGLLLDADPAALHALVCDLGRHDVSVTLLEHEVAPLVALFDDLTGAS